MGAYIYGDLSPAEMREVRLHTQNCLECREDLEERGRIIASLSDGAPVLSDDERQSIVWSVKGAVRQQDQEREYSRARLAPAYVIVLVLAVGMVVGSTISARMGSHKSSDPQQVAVKKDDNKTRKEKAKVRITEQRVVQNADQKEINDDPTAKIVEGVTRAMQLLPAATVKPGNTTARDQDNPERKAQVKPEEPLSIVPHNEEEKVETQSGTTQLPKPQDVNDAQSTPDNRNEQ